MHEIKYIMAFILGAGLGVYLTHQYWTKKNTTILNQEMKDFQEQLIKKYTETSSVETQPETSESANSSDPSFFDMIISEKEVRQDSKKDFVEYASMYKGKSTEEGAPMPKFPYRIEPDEYGELDGYSLEELTYYGDGVLTDLNDEPIENIDELIGEENLKDADAIDNYASIFVRNERLMIDYQIMFYPEPYHADDGE